MIPVLFLGFGLVKFVVYVLMSCDLGPVICWTQSIEKLL